MQTSDQRQPDQQAAAYCRWAERYTGDKWQQIPQRDAQPLRMSVHDTWTDKPVSITHLPIAANSRETLLARARTLQQCDHAHLQPILDFEFASDNLFVFVTPDEECQPLTGYIKPDPPGAADLLLLLNQFLGVLLYFESTAPHTVPRLLAEHFFLRADSDLLVKEFQCAYLQGQSSENPLRMTAEFISLLFPAASNERREQLQKLHAELLADKPPPAVNSLHKVRGLLRRLQSHA
jgi:hypothetical protein